MFVIISPTLLLQLLDGSSTNDTYFYTDFLSTLPTGMKMKPTATTATTIITKKLKGTKKGKEQRKRRNQVILLL